MAEGDCVVPLEEMKSFVTRCIVSAGARPHHAEALAAVMVTADYRGHFSHGLNRLEWYLNDVVSGTIKSDGEPEVVKETVATALVDGKNLIGPAVGEFAMDLAIKKAKEAGIGWVSVRGANHFGIAGYYSLRAMEQGLVGMAFCNTSPHLVPTRAMEPVLGTNPISVAAPANNNDSFVLDMATSTVSFGKVEIAKRVGKQIPLGWGLGAQGQPTTDPEEVYHKYTLTPLGGSETTSGYKGYGLAMMVEIFCGILSGSHFGPNIRFHKDHDAFSDLGLCFVAIDPNAFAEGFTGRMSELIDHCRGLTPAQGETEVLVPGDPEKKHMAKCDKLGGIPYHPNQISFAVGVAEKCKVDPPKVIRKL